MGNLSHDLDRKKTNYDFNLKFGNLKHETATAFLLHSSTVTKNQQLKKQLMRIFRLVVTRFRFGKKSFFHALASSKEKTITIEKSNFVKTFPKN